MSGNDKGAGDAPRQERDLLGRALHYGLSLGELGAFWGSAAATA
jgi:hypothetical protein